MSTKKFLTKKNLIISGVVLFVIIGVIGSNTEFKKTETTTESIPCKYKTEEDPNLEKDKTEIRQECIEGEKTFTYEVIYKNNVEQSRKLVSEEITKEMAPEIKAIGTKEEEPAQANNQSSSSSTSNSSSDNTYKRDGNYTGYCKDGTSATGNPHARGRANSCYGHGGWVGN